MTKSTNRQSGTPMSLANKILHKYQGQAKAVIAMMMHERVRVEDGECSQRRLRYNPLAVPKQTE
jgi:hypothetical protein